MSKTPRNKKQPGQNTRRASKPKNTKKLKNPKYPKKKQQNKIHKAALKSKRTG